ncbi:hypothetical protein EMCRGX_G007585 [Ephydatia muelleri]
MLRGQVRSAVRWLTERMNDGGVLDPSQLVNDGSKRVLDVLREKHPDPANSGTQAFLPCHHLPPLTDVDVTGSHIEHVARRPSIHADYAAALTPLIASLTDLTNWSQCWYADDLACAAKIPKLREWFDNLCKLGPAYGYYPEPQKTVVVVDEVDEAEANACFGDIGVKVSRGQCYLGGFIGDPEGTKHYVEAKEADDSRGRPALISIRGVWQPQTAVLLDVRVIDTDAQSYASRTVDAVLCSAEQEKKRKYSAAVEDRRASFTPFVVSVDGVLGHDAQHLMKRLCDQIAVKWEKSHSEVMGVMSLVSIF